MASPNREGPPRFHTQQSPPPTVSDIFKKFSSNTRGFVVLGLFVGLCILFKATIASSNLASILSQPFWACAWDMTWALFFVGSLYVWKYDSVLTPTERDQPHVIMQRLLSVGTVTTCLVLLGPLDRPSLGIPDSILQNVTGAILGLLLMVILYTGPLVYAYLDPDAEILEKPSLSFPFIRNVVIAPLVEEIAFRSCMLPIMIRAGFSQNAAIYITPIFFGLAHVHHLFLNSNDVVKLKIAGKKLIVKKIYLSTIAQAGYTTIFGFITSYLYIHTGTLAAPLLAHVFCNYMGLPPTDFFDQPKAFVIGASYLAGLTGFFVTIRPLTHLSIFSPIV